jgi:hypothetical protein
VWYIRDHTESSQRQASKRGRADDRVRRADEDQGVRPPDVAIGGVRIAHVEECDMSGNRVHQCATAAVTANGDKPSGKFRHLGMNEMRRSILATLATNMNDDVGQTYEASGVSDCTATVMPVASMTQTSAAAPTSSAAPSTAGIAKSSHGTVGVDVVYRREAIEPMECDKENDDNGDEAMAKVDTILNERDGLFETNREFIERNNRKRNRSSYIGDSMIKVGPECHCNVNSPPCDAESVRTAVTSLLRHRTDAIALSATEDGRTMTSSVETSSVLNVNAAPTSGQLRKQPEPPKLPPSTDAADPDAAVIAERLPESTLGVTNNRNEEQMHEQPDTVTEIDPTTKSLQAALGILGADGGFTTKVITLRVMMKMREVVQQQPREQHEAHWQRLMLYLQTAKYELPELPRKEPPNPGDEIRNVQERGTVGSDVNVLCRGEQPVQAKDELTRPQDRTASVTQVWQDALEKTRCGQIRFVKRMPTTTACASNVRSRDSSSQTTRTKCDSQMLRMQEGAGAPNLAEQPRRQRTNLQQADEDCRVTVTHRNKYHLCGTVGLTGTSIFDADSTCSQLPERSSDHRVTIANVGNENKSIIDFRSLESKGNPIRSPVEAHDDFAMTTTELVTNARDLSQPETCDTALRTDAGNLSAWAHFDFLEDEEDLDDDMLVHTRAMQEARRIEHSGYRLGPRDSWLAFIEKSMPAHPTVQRLHACMRHYSSAHLFRSVEHFSEYEDDEQFDMTVDGIRIPGREITIAHMEMPDGVKCEQCEDGRIQAIGLHDMGRAGDTEAPLAGSIETASGTKRDIESTPESAGGRADASSAKRMRRASKREIQPDCSGAPISVDGASSVKLVPEPLQYSDAKVKLELPVEESNTSEALHYQSRTVKQLAAHVALNMRKSAEHAAQAGSYDVRPVQRDNAKSVVPVQHDSVEMRVKYGGAMNRGSRARATLAASEYDARGHTVTGADGVTQCS